MNRHAYGDQPWMGTPMQTPVVQLSPSAELVIDADEEVFILYSSLQSHAPIIAPGDTFRGLGHVDSRKDSLTIHFELSPGHSLSPNPSKSFSGKKRQPKAGAAKRTVEPKVLEVELVQDKTALRTRKGDTGSVVWKASIDFAQLILPQLNSGQHENSLLDPDVLRTAHVLELGAGTGLLSIALSNYVGQYTVTDIDDLLPLIRKNVMLNFDGWPSTTSLGGNITIAGLNWQDLHSSTALIRNRHFKFQPIDLLLVVDCIYHPSLLPALVETINYLTTPGRTDVLVVVELRAEDVVRHFLGLWLAMPHWTIWRLESLSMPYALWCGRKVSMAA